jgi:predicted phosphodiesterase
MKVSWMTKAYKETFNPNFDLASDLHIDFYSKFKWSKDTKTSGCDTLVIAGDISNDVKETANFLREATKNYKNVAFVDGNHDHYNCNVSRTEYKSVAENMKYLLEESIKNGWNYLTYNDMIIGDTVFIGNSGWYDWNAGDPRYTKQDYYTAWKNYIADSRLIKFEQGPDELAEKFANDLYDKVNAYNLDEKINNIVIVTHTLPIVDALMIKTEVSSNDVAWNQLNGCFYNSHMKKVYSNNGCGKIKYWVFGHTHYPKDIEEHRISFICHPKGYPTEAQSHDYNFKNLVIT